MASAVRTIKLKPVQLTAENWKPFGQIIGPSFDGKEFDSDDAQLDLSRGIPRFYILHLEKKGLTFDRITHHASVTQCLGCIGGQSWYLAVAPSSIRESADKSLEGEPSFGGNVRVVGSKAGHIYVPPSPEGVQVFRVDGPHILKLHVGTWHAGPLFKPDTMDFCNLELSNTNVVDHTTHIFCEEDQVTFEIDD